MVPGVATLDRSPDQSPGVRPISPSTGTEGNQEGWPSWVEYRSGGTGGPHPGVDIFPDLSPRAKPYCGVKCSGRKNVMSMRDLFCPDPLAGLEKMAGSQIFYCLKIKCFHS